MRKIKGDPNVYPRGLNAKKVRDIIAYYDNSVGRDLTDDADHQFIGTATSWVEVPQELLPRVRRLIATYGASPTKLAKS